jgi:hypothetical protein
MLDLLSGNMAVSTGVLFQIILVEYFSGMVITQGPNFSEEFVVFFLLILHIFCYIHTRSFVDPIDAGPVLYPPVVPLSVLQRGVGDHEEDFQQTMQSDYAGIITDLDNLAVSKLTGAYRHVIRDDKIDRKSVV